MEGYSFYEKVNVKSSGPMEIPSPDENKTVVTDTLKLVGHCQPAIGQAK